MVMIVVPKILPWKNSPFYFSTDEGRRNDLVGNHDKNDRHNQDDDPFHDVVGHIAPIEFLRLRLLVVQSIFIFHRVVRHLPLCVIL